MSDEDAVRNCGNCYEPFLPGDKAYKVKAGTFDWVDTGEGPGPADRMPAFRRDGSDELTRREFICEDCMKTVGDWCVEWDDD